MEPTDDNPLSFDPFNLPPGRMPKCPRRGCDGSLTVEISGHYAAATCTSIDCSFTHTVKRKIEPFPLPVTLPPDPVKSTVKPRPLCKPLPQPASPHSEVHVSKSYREAPDCTKPATLGNLCHTHYSRWNAAGQPPKEKWIAAGGPTPGEWRKLAGGSEAAADSAPAVNGGTTEAPPLSDRPATASRADGARPRRRRAPTAESPPATTAVSMASVLAPPPAELPAMAAWCRQRAAALNAVADRLDEIAQWTHVDAPQA